MSRRSLLLLTLCFAPTSASRFLILRHGETNHNAAGIIQQRNSHDFDRTLRIVSDRRKRKQTAGTPEPPQTEMAGFFWRLSKPMRDSLVTMARRELAPAVKAAAQEKEAHDAEKLARREEALQKALSNAVDRYAHALENGSTSLDEH